MAGFKNNCYEILEVPQGVSAAEIDEAKRTQLKFYHPDRFEHDEKMRKKAEEKTKEILEAYDVLSTQRAEYDRWLKSTGLGNGQPGVEAGGARESATQAGAVAELNTLMRQLDDSLKQGEDVNVIDYFRAIKNAETTQGVAVDSYLNKLKKVFIDCVTNDSRLFEQNLGSIRAFEYHTKLPVSEGIEQKFLNDAINSINKGLFHERVLFEKIDCIRQLKYGPAQALDRLEKALLERTARNGFPKPFEMKAFSDLEEALGISVRQKLLETEKPETLVQLLSSDNPGNWEEYLEAIRKYGVEQEVDVDFYIQGLTKQIGEFLIREIRSHIFVNRYTEIRGKIEKLTRATGYFQEELLKAAEEKWDRILEEKRRA